MEQTVQGARSLSERHARIYKCTRYGREAEEARRGGRAGGARSLERDTRAPGALSRCHPKGAGGVGERATAAGFFPVSKYARWHRALVER